MIFTFGDSHSRFGFNDISNIRINELGARLCYTFGNLKLEILNIKNYDVKENDIVIFCFGEIDCRAHIYKLVNENTSYEQIIDSITYNYFEAVKKNVEQYKNIKTIIYNVVPPSDVSLIHTKEEIQNKVLVKHKTELPWKGSNEERMKYHLYFNKKIKDLCIKNNYIFMDVYDRYCDSNGFLKRELSDYNVHIKNSIYIKEFLIENNLL